MALKEYQAKRNFRKTREPSGRRATKHSDEEALFVVQKHAATQLHYDFRLTMEGVLKSWAVPKGFPTAKSDRRLAIQVEDHPMDYARFEGTIPKGNYGAGTVMVWDIGSYEVVDGDPVSALKKGRLHLTLKGKKLKGEWTLVRMHGRKDADKPQWLLLKSGTEIKPFSKTAEDQSALTRRSMNRIASDNDAEWTSNRADSAEEKKATPARRSAKRRQQSKTNSHAKPDNVLGASAEKLPRTKAEFVEPMKALLSEELPRGTDWLYEIKFDGIRALAIKHGEKVRLISRNAKDLTKAYPAIAEDLNSLPADEAVLDGEIVALDPEGRSSFQLLQSARQAGSSAPPLFYYVFDLVQHEGRDWTPVPLARRKAMAQALVGGLPDTIRFSAAIRADSERVLQEMQARGLEGLIAKKKESSYEIGWRSGAWVKFKWTREQEFVIGGFTEPTGARSHFGAILVGFYEGGRLMFASKVGTGFDEAGLKLLHRQFQDLVQSDCPFANLPEKKSAGGRGGLTRTEMRRCTWLKPELVCQIRFAEWTRDNHLRQPAFLGLREDKDPREVVREAAT